MRHWRHTLLLVLTLLVKTIPGATAQPSEAAAQPSEAAAQPSEATTPAALTTLATTECYEFGQNWQPFSAAGSTARFLPTRDCKFQPIKYDHLALIQGAMLVRPGKEPVFVSQNVNGQKIVTRITRGALTLISAAGGNCLVFSLAKQCCGALVLYPPSADGKSSSPVHVGSGQVGEVYSVGGQTLSGNFARGTISERPCTERVALLLAWCDYPKALAIFHLQNVLEPADLQAIADLTATGESGQKASTEH